MSFYTFRYSDELTHHGVNGMKWGIRRYQNVDGTLTEEGRIHYGKNSETKRYTKQLNRIDKSTTLDKRHLSETNEKIEKTDRKINKIVTKNAKDGLAYVSNRDDDKIQKLTEQRDDYSKQADIIQKRISDAKLETNRIIEEAQAKGYSVRSKEVQRWAVEGKDILPSLMRTIAFETVALAVGSPFTLIDIPGKNVLGTNYKVNTKNR